MGTRSYIAKDIGSGKYLVIFCQLESHLETTGKLLTEYYNTPEKVDALLSLGDIYFLGEKIEPDPALPHDWYSKDYQKDATLAYGRDCGEYDWPAEEMTLEDMEDNDAGAEFIYIFTAEQEWKYCCPVAPDVRWRNVRNELAAETEISNQNSEEQDCKESCDSVLFM